MTCLFRFFEDRPAIVAWAVILLVLDIAWKSVNFFHFSFFSITIGIVLPLYLVRNIADGQVTTRIYYRLYFVLGYLLDCFMTLS